MYQEAIEETKISSQRIRYLMIILIISVLGSFQLCLRNEILIDEFLCIIAINIIFLALFSLTLLKKRVAGKLHQNTSTNYKKLAIIVFVSWILITAFSYLPDFFAPMMIVVLLLSSVVDNVSALSFGIYLNVIMCLTRGLSIYVVYCYTILIILGILLADFLHSQKEMLEIQIIIFSSSVVVPIIFYYFAYLEIKKEIFLYGILDGFVVCLFTYVFFSKFNHKILQEEDDKYDKIISENYPLVLDIKKYSIAEYQHALRVSNLCFLCAREIGVKEKTAACGGFYYRLGKMEGEPEIDNAVKLATNHCFPKDVIHIIEEYNGILRLPQTPESAIVHMVDHLVTKIELLDRNTMSSTWNQDMVIYQTLNELSQQGDYDASGLSMNQFLRVRERLVREDSIL